MMNQRFEKITVINSNPATVWLALTQPRLMKQWMGEPEMEIDVQTNWKLHSPITIRGFHHIWFENKGIVLQYEENKTLAYSHLSSVSRLEDTTDNYSIIKFVLTQLKGKTELTLTVDNFPTDTIYKHLCFYWRATTEKIKAVVEKQVEALPPTGAL
jgi:uncharacterized protein YndB with AHSA1/START domain